ncbi:LysM peptidoglycan-binding domain-containing protein [Rhizobium sp. BK251]|uniref:LysM peptidoglycan-binding domain-containing protein n=1 Tax=Rhizobium sp. BK251 TaxID=2512125 RepID=UPI001042BB82|nr:LysM peptidoglycan-binding domain-containing protein [Rhizobium sp. BK251]TCL67305.1 LysM domain-containing protein [Rhizobium sp. BK251]
MSRTHTVAAGDTLSSIAQRFYGEAGLFGFIAASNGIVNPDEIIVGQILTLPEIGRVHRVVVGDTLSEIAQTFYGDPGFFRIIASANAIRDPDHIEVGWVLSIPDRSDRPDDPFRATGILPYAIEPFGVYQPLIGWRSNLQLERVRSGIANRFQQAVNLAHLEDEPNGGLHVASPRFVDATGTSFGRELALRARTAPADPNMWQSLITEFASSPASGASALPAADAPREVATAQLLQELTTTDPQIVQQLFVRDIQPWERALAAVRLLAQTHPSKELFLSPIGILHRFREYFFELDTFLGPPVGHVWISPGGTVELIEVNTRRSLVERTVERSTEMVERSEQSTTVRDEIADAVKTENANDMKLGVSTSSSGGLGSIFQASGSASFNLDSSRKQAQEQTHKRMREQTSKLSSEVKQNFKTTFRTVTETTDTASRRYVLQNTTDRLVSYELSRKMRKVAIQVQDLGQQLCWQLYVDNPGNALDTGEFVHETADALDPSIKRPDKIPYPPDKPVTYPFAIPFLQHNGGDDDTDLTYVLSDENANHGINRNAGANSIIQFKFDIDIPPAPEGFQLKSIVSIDFKSEQAQYRITDADLQPNPNTSNNKFSIRLTKANFGGKKAMPFEATMLYTPTKAAKDAIDAKNATATADYNDLVAAEKERLFYQTLRKRIKLSSQVPSRRPEDLREEERNIIYRAIISRLYGKTAGWENDDYHVASELIRYFFDIDAMLYFVAPDWWRPRAQIRVAMNAAGQLQSTSLVSDRQKYLFTEESEPAPLGASLGWFLQLDGDANRNAFLNSPWVKAVLPIRPGRERDAMTFLGRPEVAGTDGLEEAYPFDASQDPPEYQGRTLREVLLMIAEKIADEHELSMTPVPVRPGAPNAELALPTETVFSHGFDPLAGGIAFGKEPFKVFSQWIEILPTDQVVATEYRLTNSN